jgi:translocation and assembly module TamA
MQRSVRLWLVLLVCGLCRAVPAAADEPYRVTFAGITVPAVADALENASQLVALANRPPASPAALRRRTLDDLPRLEAALHAEGYWQAKIAYRIDANEHPAHVTITPVPGPLFHIARVAFVLPSAAPATLMADKGAAAIGLAPGTPARSAPVADGNARIVALYGENGYPFAQVSDRHVTVDVATATMSVTYVIEPGQAARFGATTITGLRRTARDFVTRRIAWTMGARYDVRAVETTRQALVRSTLFSAVSITHAVGIAADGTVAMTITVTEGPPRSIGAGAGYNTNLGFGARTFWEHRNLLGEGEDLRLTAGAAQRQLGVGAEFRRPDFAGRKIDLLANAALLHETTDAYRSRRWRGYVGLEDLAFPTYTLGAGVSLERAYLTESTHDENYLLLGTPFYLRRDTSDDLLNPTKGTRTNVTITPYHGLLARDLSFISARIEERGYQRLDARGHVVLAGYAALGSIVGASLAGLPADKRLYAGGAGSVRGYGYQRAGPLDVNGDPSGGRSSLEFGTELRYRITDTIGLVPFFDAGNVYASNLPNKPSLFYGAGIGLRYYTAIGPIRLDLAFPIDKRAGDSAVQVYISIGQAF